LPEVIEDVLSFLKEEFHIRGVRVEKNFDPSIPTLCLDFEQMVQVFLNLFLNAVQAMPGGGTLKIGTRCCDSDGSVQEAPGIPAQGTEGKRWVEVAVEDTGEGMAAEVLQEVFRPFYTTKSKGTGLGLSLSRRIIEQHRGQIFARSEIGAGTTFYLRLPLPSACGSGGPFAAGEPSPADPVPLGRDSDRRKEVY
jgi:signal transduction histidine kinase